MADSRSTLLECSVKIRQGRKWKTRWCVMTRQSPVSAEVILRFYKDQDALVLNKELRREVVCVSATNYCGLECSYRYPKNTYVLNIVLSHAVILLSFQTHERLLEWYHKIKNTLPSEIEFKMRVSIPNKAKLPQGRGAFYFYNNHFTITPENPTRLICSWDLAKVIRYGIFEGGFAFSVRSSKGSSNHLLLVDNPESIKNHFDAASRKLLPTRWSTHSDLNPAARHNAQTTHTAERQRLLNFNERDNDNETDVQHAATVERTMEKNANEEQHETDTLLINGADHNSNTCIASDSGVTSGLSDVDKNTIEMRELRTTRQGSRMNVNETDGSSNRVVMREETQFVNDLLLCPQKNTPIRDQEYEVMASFDHYRSSVHGDADMGSVSGLWRPESNYQSRSVCQTRSHQGAYGGGRHRETRLQQMVNMDRFKLNLNPDEREYVNLPSPTSTMSRSVPLGNRRNNLPTEIIDRFDFSPPASPPPPPPVLHKRTNSGASSRDGSTPYGLYPSLESARSRDLFRSPSQESDIVVPIPFEHSSLVKPLGPISRLKRDSQDSETSSFIASGSEYDSSHYSSAASSRHNSFDREPFLKPPPVPPKSANRRLPSIEALLSSGNFRHDPFLLESHILASTSSGSPPAQDDVPPIPPKPEHLRGRSLHREPSSPSSPTGRPPFLPPRKRCNTVPSFRTEEGDTEWLEVPNEGDEGYLVMKPVYDDKLKAMHVRSKSVPDEESIQSQSLPPMPSSPWLLTSSGRNSPARIQSPGTPAFQDPYVNDCIPQSPIHDANAMRIQTLKRSATIGGFGHRTSRSPSFTGRRPSLLRGSRHRGSLTSHHSDSHRTSDISLSSVPKPRRRRSDKYGSLDHRSMSLRSNRLEDFNDEISEVPSSPTAATPFLPGDFQQLKDDLDKFAGPLSLSPPSSVNSPVGTPPLTPASSQEALHQ